MGETPDGQRDERPAPSGRSAGMRWTSGSTLAAALAATIFYPWIVTHYRFEAFWQPVVLTACIALLAGGFWRQALKLVIGGGAALLVHAQLAAGAGPDVPVWQPVVLAALAGLVTLCLWRLLAVAGAVVALLMVLRLVHDGVPPELILEAIRIRLE